MNYLKMQRKTMGLTQSEIANRAQISVRAYQNYEADERVPNAYIAQTIAQALSSTVESLFPIIPQRQLRENDTQGNFNP